MRLILSCTALSTLLIVGLPAHAGFDAVQGSWKSEAIMLDPPIACAPEALNLEISGSATEVSVEIDGGDAFALDTTLATGKDGKVFVEESGWMSRFGMGDESTRDDLIANKPVLWARETETGAIIYRSQIAKAGTLEILRIALEPVDGAITATVALRTGDCDIPPFTTALTQQ